MPGIKKIIMPIVLLAVGAGTGSGAAYATSMLLGPASAESAGAEEAEPLPEPPPPEAIPSCAEAGVLGVLPAVIGGLQATEAVKLLLGIGESLSGRLLVYDALHMDFRTLKVGELPARPAVSELIDYEQFCGVASQT